MADQTLTQTRTDELKGALQALIASGDNAKVDYLATVLERVLTEQQREAEAEANRKADTFVAIPGLAIEGEMALYDAVSQRLNQVRAIADLMGIASDGTPEDDTLPNAAWAIKSLLDEADALTLRMIRKH